jgi:TonB family protein
MLLLSLGANGQTQVPGNADTGKAAPQGVFRVGGDVIPPRGIYHRRPDYSETARAAGLEGTCRLWLVVGMDGKPWSIRVGSLTRVHSLGLGLDEKAIEAVSLWRFEPASKGGKPVSVAISVEITFQLHAVEEKAILTPKKEDASGSPKMGLGLSEPSGDRRPTTIPAPASQEFFPAIDTSDCQALSVEDHGANKLSAVCEFARTFLHDLPDFICEQTTTSGGWPAKVLKEEVKFDRGEEVYTNPTLGGKSAKATSSSSAVNGMHFKSSGELGSDLVNLFEKPIVTEFQFRKEATLRKVSASVYQLHLTAEKNTFFVLRDSYGHTLLPAFDGELWLDPRGRPLRLELHSMHTPPSFGLASVELAIDYSEVPVSGLDTFLLPSKSETKVCNRGRSGITCNKNIVAFDNCRKFAAKSRILSDGP